MFDEPGKLGIPRTPVPFAPTQHDVRRVVGEKGMRNAKGTEDGMIFGNFLQHLLHTAFDTDGKVGCVFHLGTPQVFVVRRLP